jgi:hypothetical protein
MDASALAATLPIAPKNKIVIDSKTAEGDATTKESTPIKKKEKQAVPS